MVIGDYKKSEAVGPLGKCSSIANHQSQITNQLVVEERHGSHRSTENVDASGSWPGLACRGGPAGGGAVDAAARRANPPAGGPPAVAERNFRASGRAAQAGG